MFEELLEALQSTGIPFEAYHWHPAPKEDYGTLTIIGGGDIDYADNTNQQQAVNAQCDLFVHGASLVNPRKVQDALRSVPGIGWSLGPVQYEPETRLVHFSWDVSLRAL